MTTISAQDITVIETLGERFRRVLEEQPKSIDTRLDAAQAVVDNILKHADQIIDPKTKNFGASLNVITTVLATCLQTLKDASLENSEPLIETIDFARQAYIPIMA